MSSALTFNKLFNQLPKEDFGSDRSKFKTEDGKTGYIVGMFNGAILVSWIECPPMIGDVAKEPEQAPLDLYSQKVEWIGNKPRTKLMAPAIYRVTTAKAHRPQVSEELYESLADAKGDLEGSVGDDRFQNKVDVIKWPAWEPTEVPDND